MEDDKPVSQCAAEGMHYPNYRLNVSELKLFDRRHRVVERRIRAARFPTIKSLDTFDFPSIPSLNKALAFGTVALRAHRT